MSNDKPNPGSPEAIKKGCTCPVLDNGHGKGHLGEWGKVRVVDVGRLSASRSANRADKGGREMSDIDWAEKDRQIAEALGYENEVPAYHEDLQSAMNAAKTLCYNVHISGSNTPCPEWEDKKCTSTVMVGQTVVGNGHAYADTEAQAVVLALCQVLDLRKEAKSDE